MRKSWSDAEDLKLVKLVGESNSTITKWAELSCHMGDRTPYQCRARYNNSFKPDGKKGQWSNVEDEHIIRLHAEFGNQWSKISSGGKCDMLNDDLFVIILNPNLYLFRNPHFLQLHPVAQATTSRIVWTWIFYRKKERGQKHLRHWLMPHLRMRSNELYWSCLTMDKELSNCISHWLPARKLIECDRLCSLRSVLLPHAVHCCPISVVL